MPAKPGMGVEVKGLWYGEEFISTLRIELGTAALNSSKRIAADARRRVPYSNAPITKKHPGHLRDTIVAREAKGERWKPGAFVFAGDRLKGIYWQFMVEYGTAKYAARPYMRPAVAANRSTTLGAFTTRTQRAIEAKRQKAIRLAMGKKR